MSRTSSINLDIARAAVAAMKKYLVLYVATALVLVVVDGVWLGVVAREFYRSRVGHLMAPGVNWSAAAAFYLIYPLGVVIFASTPALAAGSWSTALLYGALFGFFAYVTYDLTNLATLRDWPVSLVAADVTWGTLITGVSATAGLLLESLVSRSS
jgi:uncharacterized membrane protein